MVEPYFVKYLMQYRGDGIINVLVNMEHGRRFTVPVSQKSQITLHRHLGGRLGIHICLVMIASQC